jgi:hypothetical protein
VSRGSDTLVRGAKVGYAAAARGAGRGLQRARLLPARPPTRDHLIRHWAYSLGCVHDSAALIALDVPWWTYRAIDAVEGWLAERRHPIRVFEYGSGASTLWLARRADEVITVEHDATFAATLAPRLEAAGNVVLQVVPDVPSDHPVVGSAKAGYGRRDFADYVAAIDAYDTFDLLVVDGRARPECLARGLPHLRGDGLIVFDNSARRRYRAGITSAPVTETRLRGLTPTLPYPEQTSLLRPLQTS